MTQEAQMQLAAKLMKLSMEQVQEYGGTIPGSGAYYLSVPQRGFDGIADRGTGWYGAVCRLCHRL